MAGPGMTARYQYVNKSVNIMVTAHYQVYVHAKRVGQEATAPIPFVLKSATMAALALLLTHANVYDGKINGETDELGMESLCFKLLPAILN